MRVWPGRQKWWLVRDAYSDYDEIDELDCNAVRDCNRCRLLRLGVSKGRGLLDNGICEGSRAGTAFNGAPSDVPGQTYSRDHRHSAQGSERHGEQDEPSLVRLRSSAMPEYKPKSDNDEDCTHPIDVWGRNPGWIKALALISAHVRQDSKLKHSPIEQT